MVSDKEEINTNKKTIAVVYLTSLSPNSTAFGRKHFYNFVALFKGLCSFIFNNVSRSFIKKGLEGNVQWHAIFF